MRFLYENTALFTKNARFAEIPAILGTRAKLDVLFLPKRMLGIDILRGMRGF